MCDFVAAVNAPYYDNTSVCICCVCCCCCQGNVKDVAFKKELFGRTKGSYSTVIVAYEFRSRSVTDYDNSTVVYIQGEGEAAGYVIGECFHRSLDLAYLDWDPKIFSLYPQNTPGSSDHKCYTDLNQTVCQGSLNLTMGYKSRYWITAGNTCTRPHNLDLWYNVTVIGYDFGETPCVNLTHYFDQLPVIPKTLELYVNTCRQFYPSTARWNLYGYSQYKMAEMHLYLLSGFPCYKHSMEYICRIFLPECKSSTIHLACGDMCVDFLAGCQVPYFKFRCAKLENSTTHGDTQCVFTETTCDPSEILVPQYSRISTKHANDNDKVTDLTKLDCVPFYKPDVSNKEDFGVRCWYDGKWHLSDPKGHCVLSLGQVLVCTIISVVLILIVTLGVFYYFRYEVRLLVFKYCSFFLCCFRMRRTPNDNGRRYHAFISYCRDNFVFVDDCIYGPLTAEGYQLAVDYACVHLLPGTHTRGFADVMEHSATCIIVISQSYLDNKELMFEFDMALMYNLDDPDFTLIPVATEPIRDLRNVPRWLRAYKRTHLFIDADDFELLAKLRRELPELNACRGGEDVGDVALDNAADQPSGSSGESNDRLGDSTMIIDTEHEAMELRAPIESLGDTDTALLLP